MKGAALKDKLVVVTRPKTQARTLIAALRRKGLRVALAPMIRIAPPKSFKALDESLAALASFDGVLFTSRNAVESFFERCQALRLRPRPPRLLYAVGPETASALAERGWKARLPKEHRGRGMAAALGKVRGARLLLPRARQAREDLPRLLRQRGAKVAEVEAYRTVSDDQGRRALRAAAKKGISAVAFASGSAVEQVVRGLGRAAARRLFRTAAAVSIGPATSSTLRCFGIRPAAQAKTATSQELARAVIKALGENGR